MVIDQLINGTCTAFARRIIIIFRRIAALLLHQLDRSRGSLVLLLIGKKGGVGICGSMVLWWGEVVIILRPVLGLDGE